MSERESFNLDAVAVEAEDAPPFVFTWHGETYALPNQMAMPLAEQLALADMTEAEAVRHLLGADADKLFATGISTGRVLALVHAWLAYQGLAPGESPALPRSSANTARR